jgi:hypothetical protein
LGLPITFANLSTARRNTSSAGNRLAPSAVRGVTASHIGHVTDNDGGAATCNHCVNNLVDNVGVVNVIDVVRRWRDDLAAAAASAAAAAACSSSLICSSNLVSWASSYYVTID